MAAANHSIGTVHTEARSKALEECDRLRKEYKEESDRKQTATAIAAGFSSYEEYLEDLGAREQELWEGYEKREAALLGTTVEEFWTQHPQRWVSPPQMPQCDCEEHPIPIFCPRRLVDFRSMDAPDIEWLENRSHRAIEEIQLVPGGTSKRLDDETLKLCWVSNSQQEPQDLPLWTKADETLQRIIGASEPSNAAPLDVVNCSTPSSISVESTSDSFGKAKPAQSSPGTDLEYGLQPSSFYKNHKVEVEKDFNPTPLPKGHRQSVQMCINGKGRRSLQDHHSISLQQPRVLRSTYKDSGKATRIQKRTSRHHMRTRLGNVVEFYELGSDGVARSYRRCRT